MAGVILLPLLRGALVWLVRVLARWGWSAIVWLWRTKWFQQLTVLLTTFWAALRWGNDIAQRMLPKLLPELGVLFTSWTDFKTTAGQNQGSIAALLSSVDYIVPLHETISMFGALVSLWAAAMLVRGSISLFRTLRMR